MTICSVLLLLYLIFIFKESKSLNKIIISLIYALLFFELYANAGLFLSSGMAIRYSDVIWFVTLIVSLICIKKQKNQYLTNWLTYISTLILLILIEVIFPYDSTGFNSRSFMVFIKYLSMSLLYIVVKNNINNKYYYDLFRINIQFQHFIYVVVCFEFFYKNIFGADYNGLISSIFGVSIHQVTFDVTRGGILALQGLCKEPSHLAIALFIANLFNIKSEQLFGFGRRNIFINSIILLISGSLSSVLYVLVSTISYYYYFPKSLKPQYLILVFIAAIIFVTYNYTMIEYYTGRIIHILEFNGEFDTYTSEGVRLGDSYKSWKLFCNNPLTGIGLGNNVNTGGGTVFLSTLGIMGVIAYTKMFINKQNYIIFLCVFIPSLFAMDGGIFYSSHICLLYLLWSIPNKNIK